MARALLMLVSCQHTQENKNLLMLCSCRTVLQPNTELGRMSDLRRKTCTLSNPVLLVPCYYHCRVRFLGGNLCYTDVSSLAFFKYKPGTLCDSTRNFQYCGLLLIPCCHSTVGRHAVMFKASGIVSTYKFISQIYVYCPGCFRWLLLNYHAKQTHCVLKGCIIL